MVVTVGLEEIVGRVSKDAGAKVREIIEQAQADALKIRDHADEEAELYLKERKSAADYEARQLILREASKAKVDAKSVYRDRISEILGGSFAQLESELEQYAKGEDYIKLLSKLMELAAEELGENCTLYMLEKDMRRVKFPAGANKGILKEETIGGLKGISEDGRLSVDFTLENIIELLRDSISAKALGLIERGV